MLLVKLTYYIFNSYIIKIVFMVKMNQNQHHIKQIITLHRCRIKKRKADMKKLCVVNDLHHLIWWKTHRSRVGHVQSHERFCIVIHILTPSAGDGPYIMAPLTSNQHNNTSIIIIKHIITITILILSSCHVIYHADGV